MDAIQIFIENFNKSWKNKNNDALLRILKSLPDSLKHVPKRNRAIALDSLFDKQKGLFKFMQFVLHNNDIVNFKMSIQESFNALQFIMELCNQEYKVYIFNTTNICFCYIKTFCWFYIRKSAAETLRKLIKLFMDSELQLDNIIEHYIDSYLRLYLRKDGSILYIVLGAIARYCPKTTNMSQFVDTIFYNLENDLKNQLKPSDEKQPQEIKIYLDCYWDMFTNFIPFEGHSKKSIYLEKLYGCLLKLCENNTDKVIKNKSIYFLSTYIIHFSNFISRDYKKWHTLLNNYTDDKYTASALIAFYKIMALYILNENNNEIFLYLKNDLISNLRNKDLPTNKLGLVINGLGEFSVAYAKYLPTEITDVFQMIALRTQPFYIEKYEMDTNFNTLSDYLRTLSQILQHIPNISQYHINVVIELSILFIKKFPNTNRKNRDYIVNALKSTFLNIICLEKNVQSQYFKCFFREGILNSCSHRLFIDVELQQQMQSLPEYPICYKNYLPLWQSLFKIESENQFSQHFILQIFNEFISVLILFVDNLNFNVNFQDDNLYSDTFSLLKVENKTDFQFFINLVDLYIDVFENIKSILLKNWIEKLIIYFIKYSYKYSLISGFYKLIKVIFTFCCDEICFNESTCELITQYICNVIKLIPGFSGELQVSCIYLIFSIPLHFIKDLISQISSVFKIAFNIGLNDLSLAFDALKMLENLINNPEIQCSRDFVMSAIHYVDPYLSCEYGSLNISAFTIKDKKETLKNITNANDDESLEQLQKKILLFYGSLDLNILLDFIHEKSIQTNATWNKKNLFQHELLFPDIRLVIYFDKFIPRIIELTKSVNNKTKFSACELLHTLILVIVEKKLMDQCFNKTMCYTVLRLASDSNDTIRNLYYPLVIQLTHYLSSNLMKESRIPQVFIDSLFEGLTEEFNTCIRDCCGLYLKEFVEWSVKQSNESEFASLLNMRNIVHRITNSALYPSNKKHLAAAIAFNHLFSILQENSSILNIYWLEFLYAFVKCLEHSDDIQIICAINRIEKVIRNNASIFNIESTDRRRPPGFPDVTLKGVLIWLFNYCASLNIKCRCKSRELFEHFLPLTSEYDFIKSVLMDNVNEIVLKNLEEDFEYITINNSKAMLRSLDFYIWILKRKFLPLEFLKRLEDSFTNGHIFFKCFNKFISIIINQNIQILDKDYLNTLMEKEELSNLKNNIILKTLEFISIILLENDLKNKYWNDDLNLLIMLCTLSPHKIGVSSRSLTVIEKLPETLKILLTLIKSILSQESFFKCQKYFVNKLRNEFLQIKKINDVVNHRTNIYTLKQLIKGLIILKKTKFIDFEHYNFTISYSMDIILNIYNVLKIVIMSNDACKILDEDIKEYLEELMKFLFQDYQPTIIEYIIRLIIIDNQLINSTGCTISHGKYFLEVFKKPLFDYMLKSVFQTMKIFDKFLDEYADKIFFIIEELLMFIKNNKRSESEILADAVIDRCRLFEREINGVAHRKLNFLNINKIAVSLKKKPIEAIRKNGSPNALYSWILEELFTSNNLEKKTIFLQHFLICLVDEESTIINPELFIVFRQLRDEDTSVWLKKLESDDTLRFQAISCFQMLLKMLVITKSLTLYQGLIKYTAGMYNCLFKENIKEYLNLYFANLSDVNALKSLEIAYKMFMEFNLSVERLDVLKYFLLPSIESNKTSIIEKFYVENYKEIISYVIRKISDVLSSTEDRIKLIISKIGSYNIFELLFAKFELKFMTVVDSTTHIEKSINQILVRQAMDLRSLITKNAEEKEMTRLLHCAGFNCCTTLISMKKDEVFYPLIFYEDKKTNALIWDRIVDCDRKYNFNETTSSVKKDIKTLINIRRNNYNNEENPRETADSYYHHYSLASLTYFEDVHAFDLNDYKILTQVETNVEVERRLSMSFESDELNEHECMPMISGVLVHMFNNEIYAIPEGQIGTDQLPRCLKYFRNSFATRHDNVRLFLMKIIGNAKNAFVPCIKAFFQPLLGTIDRYLASNPLNYIVRDILVILIQSRYKPIDEGEIKDAQKLIERLIEVAADHSPRFFRYNLDLIENLTRLWIEQLHWPKILENKVNLDCDLVVKASLALLHAGLRGITDCGLICNHVWSAMQLWTEEESKVLARFEALGWIMRLRDKNCSHIGTPELTALLSNIEAKNQDRWARCLFALHRGWGPRAQSGPTLIELKRLPEHAWPEALDLFLRRLPHLQPDRLHTEFLLLDLSMYLRERSSTCAGPALRILAALVPRLAEPELRPLLLLAVRLTGPAGTPEQRWLGYAALAEAYLHYKDAFYLRWLVRGLDDPSEKVHEEVLKFWRNRISMPKTSSERLLFILDLYVPELESAFAHFLCLSMLDLAANAPDGERLLLDILDNNVAPTSWKFASLGTHAPLFVPSLISRLNMPGSWLDADQSVPKRMPDPSQNELSWRPNSRELNAANKRHGSYRRRFVTDDYEKSNVTQQGFVESVKRLLAQDTMFCKDFAVALVCQLIERLRGSEKYDDFVNNLTASFDRTLQAQQEEDSDFLAVILEIVLRSKLMRVNAETIGKVCKTPSLNALGILLLEQNINEEREEDPPPKKRAKTDDLEEKGNWMKLATLFKSIGKGDLVKSIFKRPNVFIKEMREAAMAHANTEWLEAKDLYEIAYEVTFSPEKDFCLENMFECFYELSSWGEINKKTDIILDGNYNSVWESPKRQLLLPWILRGQLQQSLEVFNDGKELENANFIANFDSWIQSKESFMKKTYGEEMAMFYICGQETDEISRHSVKCHLDYLREQWTRLSPLSKILKTQILMKLRAIYNINNYIELLRSTDIVEASKSIIRYWDQHVPSPNDELSIWNIHVSYRLTLASILHRKLFENGVKSMAFKEIIAASIRQRLKITELAMKHKNHVIAKKHVLRCEIMLNQLDGNDYLKLKHDFTLTASKYKFFCGQRFTDTAKKFKYYLCSWQITDQIIKDNNADLVTKINAKHHLFDLALALKSSAEKNPEFLHLLMETNIFKEMDKPDGANILDAFKTYSFNILKNVCESSNDTVMAKSYTKFGKYCYTFLYGIYQRDSTISDQFISSILIGMALGSLEAAHYFPCLLKEEFYENEQSVQLFISKSKNVPSWMFLSWQAQILAYLNKPIAKLLIPILYRLVSDYPYGIMYNFRHIYEALPSLRINCKIQSMYESLFSNPKIDTFFKAMHRVCQPEHYMRYYLLKFFESDGNFSNSIDTLIENIFIQQVQDNSLQGLIYRVLDKYKRRLNEVKEMDCENAKKHLRNIAIDLYESMKKRLANVNRQALQIKDYSPYLSNFSGEDIELEIPGQYRDNVKPMPHYHIKILKFHRFVRVMDSKCNPIKIKMIGNDALTYDFLTKFGEDLRLDQRLQQIFNITNKTLEADINCKKRHLSINTYNVIALSSSLGLIQWVDETKSLKEFVQFSMADKTIIETVSLKYQSWIKKAGRSDGLSSAYKRAVTEYHPNEVISKMKEFINVINPDCLRKTFVMLSPSLECFVSLRHNFITSYATMCTIHWITGVGDRHLENLLIEVKSGKCYGIDFGLAFGTGIDQSIPELVPFRLTAQILGLFKPFTEEDLFGITMTHVLNALRIEQGPMVACLDIFIQEPLDWSKHANKHLNDEQEKDFKWLPRKKIEIIEKKLNGGNPSKIMVEELSIMHDDENLFEGTLYKYTHIINGTDSKHIRKRSRMKTEFLTSEKQVQCLVEQATDLNILGRMWVGWAPYV